MAAAAQDDRNAQSDAQDQRRGGADAGDAQRAQHDAHQIERGALHPHEQRRHRLAHFAPASPTTVDPRRRLVNRAPLRSRAWRYVRTPASSPSAMRWRNSPSRSRRSSSGWLMKEISASTDGMLAPMST